MDPAWSDPGTTTTQTSTKMSDTLSVAKLRQGGGTAVNCRRDTTEISATKTCNNLIFDSDGGKSAPSDGDMHPGHGDGAGCVHLVCNTQRGVAGMVETAMMDGDRHHMAKILRAR